MKQPPRPYQIVLMVSGAVMFLFSFLPVVEVGGILEGNVNAWQSPYFPLMAIPALIGLAVGVITAVSTFGTARVPDFITLNDKQLTFAMAFTSVAMLITMLLITKGGFSLALGFWFMFIGIAGLMTGSVLGLLDKATVPAGYPAGGFPPGGYPPAGSYPPAGAAPGAYPGYGGHPGAGPYPAQPAPSGYPPAPAAPGYGPAPTPQQPGQPPASYSPGSGPGF